MAKLPQYHVLFLSDHATERSFLAEALLLAKDPSRFRVARAGLHPSSTPSHAAEHILRERYEIVARATAGPSWQDLTQIEFDFVITLSNSAHHHSFRWPGQPVRAHWGSPTPDEIALTPEGRSQALIDIASQIAARVTYFSSRADAQLVGAAWEAGRRYTFRNDYSAIDDEHIEWATPQLRACGY